MTVNAPGIVATKKQRANKLHRRRQHQEAAGSPRRDPIADAIEELKELRQNGRVVEVRRAVLPGSKTPAIHVVLHTGDIDGISRGLTVEDTTDICLVLGNDYPDSPPCILVDPDPRYVGFPHVIFGRMLCVYLDPKREWHPSFGMLEAIDRVWEWFDNAANDRFDPRASLFHAIGGAYPCTDPSTTVVVQTAPPPDLPVVSQSALLTRTSNRVEIAGWRRARRDRREIPLPTFVVPNSLPFGIRGTVASVAAQVEESGGCKAHEFLEKIARTSTATQPNTPIYLCLIVAHPTETDLPSLAVGRIIESLADNLRTTQKKIPPQETPIDWLIVSDERPNTTTRRDFDRPAAGFLGSTVEIWGCGGLGSWIAELLVRTKPKKVVLRDPGLVSRGLLVRQNYTELDVGRSKAQQLAERLEAISDDTVVEFESRSALDAIKEGRLPDCDLVIDATISETIAFHLDKAATENTDGPLLIQVATNIENATLGLVVVAAASFAGGPASVERHGADEILDAAHLESYHTFWNPTSPTAELTPAPGCSVPTYHGAAADLAAVAGTMVSLAGAQLKAPVTGIHLFALPHAEVVPSSVFYSLNCELTH